MSKIEIFKKYYLPYLGFYNLQIDSIDPIVEDKIAEKYFAKFNIPEGDWLSYDKIRDLVFNTNKNYPEMVFRSQEFNFISSIAGIGVDNQTLTIINNIANFFDDEFFIIEHYPILLYGKDFGLRMKFPKNISWEEFSSGSYLSIALEKAPLDDSFIIYGDSGKWGYLISNDYWADKNVVGIPLSIIGFDPEYEDIFKSSFPKPNDEDLSLIQKSLPTPYLNRWVY